METKSEVESSLQKIQHCWLFSAVPNSARSLVPNHSEILGSPVKGKNKPLCASNAILLSLF